MSDDAQWLTMRYQIINSPASVRIITLPALTLKTEQEQEIDVSPWSFSIAPLTPVEPADDTSLPVMQADWRAESPTSITLWHNIRLLLACLILTLLLWLIWWFLRGIADARSLPFARAFRIIRQHTGGDAPETTSNWLALHRAFDQFSGRSIGRDSIEALVNNTHWLTPFKSDIQTFYKASAMRFFANDPSGDPIRQVIRRAIRQAKRQAISQAIRNRHRLILQNFRGNCMLRKKSTRAAR